MIKYIKKILIICLDRKRTSNRRIFKDKEKKGKARVLFFSCLDTDGKE